MNTYNGVKLLYTVGRLGGGCWKPPRASRGSEQCPQKNFSAYAYKVEGNRRIERIKI